MGAGAWGLPWMARLLTNHEPRAYLFLDNPGP